MTTMTGDVIPHTEREVTGRILRLADLEERIVTGLICPFNRQVWVSKPDVGFELYKPGAFDASLADRSRRIPLTLGHVEDVAGFIVDHRKSAEGQIATFRILRTRAGDDALELINAEVVTGLSIGARAIPAATVIRTENRRRVIERSRVDLDHVALLRAAAYSEARIFTPGSGRNLHAVPDSPAVVRAKARQRRHRRQLERIDSKLAYLRALDAS